MANPDTPTREPMEAESYATEYIVSLHGNPLWEAIWATIKGWDLSRTGDGLYAGATGDDATRIYEAVLAALPPARPAEPTSEAVAWIVQDERVILGHKRQPQIVVGAERQGFPNYYRLTPLYAHPARAEPWPEVLEEDIAWFRALLVQSPDDGRGTQKMLARILRVLEHAKGASDDTRRLDWLEKYGLGQLDIWQESFRAATDAARRGTE